MVARTPPLLAKYLRKYVIKKPNQITLLSAGDPIHCVVTSQTKYSEPLNLVKLWMISTSEENLVFLFITAFVEKWWCPFALYSWSCHKYKHLSKMFLIGSVSEIWENVSKIFCSFWRSAFAPAKAKDEWRWNFNLPENQNGFHNDEILPFATEGGGLSLGNHVANENHSWTAQTCFALTLVSHWIVRPGPSNRFWSS